MSDELITLPDEEFLPLPHYPYDARPHTTPIHPDEAATAIHLAKANLPEAARLLRTTLVRLDRLLRNTPKLQLVLDEHLRLLAHHAAAEHINALLSPNSDDRRREWGATKILTARLAQTHPHAPAPPPPPAPSASLSLTQGNRTLSFRWRTDADDATTIDHEPSPPADTPTDTPDTEPNHPDPPAV